MDILSNNWTKSAIDCYERGYNCKGCIFENYFSDKHKCKMKKYAKLSLKKFGYPFQQRIRGAYAKRFKK